METIKAAELHNRLTDGDIDEILVDVREPFEFKAKHIQGSKNIPLDKIETAIERLKPIKTVYVHCQSGGRSSSACEILSNAGINVVNLEGGLSAWEDAGFDIEESGHHVIPIIRQVMIVAGTLVLIGVILGIYVNPWWYLLSGFMGAGLLFAGITGICSMTYILKYMPWNRN
jgi:rhodanese-related sulfurtransferase